VAKSAQLASLALVLAACGGSPAPATPTPVVAAESGMIADMPSGPLVFDEISLFEGDEPEPGMKIHGDGTIETRSVHYANVGDPGVSTWKTVAAIAPDFSFTVQGQPAGKLDTDGALLLADGQRSEVTITDDKATVGPYWMALDATGAVTSAKQPKRPMRVEGASDPVLRRRALLAMSIVFAWPFAPAK
jgi:hypothetical protein